EIDGSIRTATSARKRGRRRDSRGIQQDLSLFRRTQIDARRVENVFIVRGEGENGSVLPLQLPAVGQRCRVLGQVFSVLRAAAFHLWSSPVASLSITNGVLVLGPFRVYHGPHESPAALADLECGRRGCSYVRRIGSLSN